MSETAKAPKWSIVQSGDGIASFADGEVARIEQGIVDLAKDPHAPRELSVKVILHVHNEYPKLMYKGEGTKYQRSVANADEEKAAVADGYHEYRSDHPVEDGPIAGQAQAPVESIDSDQK